MRLLDRSLQMPASRTVRHRLGYRRALELVGYHPPHGFKAANSALYRQRLCDRLINRIIAGSAGRVTSVPRSLANTRPRICVDNHYVIEVFVVPSVVVKSGKIRWPLRATCNERRRPVLLCRLNRSNRGLHSMYFIPEFCMLKPFHRVNANDVFLSRSVKLASPEAFIGCMDQDPVWERIPEITSIKGSLPE